LFEKHLVVQSGGLELLNSEVREQAPHAATGLR